MRLSAATGVLAMASALAMVPACSLRAPRLGDDSCNSNGDCGFDRVCFANQCRSPASALSSVMVEVTPPTSSPYAPLQQALDLKASAVATLNLQPPKQYNGTLVQNSSTDGGVPQAVASAALQLYDAAPLIPGRAFSVSAVTDQSGRFAVRAPPVVQTLLITPPPQSSLPYFTFSVPSGNTLAAIVQLPAASLLTRVSGALTAAGAPVASARVTPIDAEGNPLSAAASTDPSGAFTLLLPPPPITYELRVGEAPDGGTSVPGGGPLPSFDDSAFGLSTAQTTSVTANVDIGLLPLPVSLSGVVIDDTGAPVANARVTAASDDGVDDVLTRSTTTAGDGSFSLAVRQGSYLIEAAPSVDPAQPAVSPAVQVQAFAATVPLTLVCPAKVRATGRILRSGGTTLPAGAQVTATRLADQLIGARVATTTATDSTGSFTLIGDPGQYQIQVVPTVESGEPQQLVIYTVTAPPPGSAALQLEPIQLSPPLVVAGSVRGLTPGLAPALLVGASVDVYAVSTNDAAVKLGGAVTDSSGNFRLVVPDVSQPFAGALKR